MTPKEQEQIFKEYCKKFPITSTELLFSSISYMNEKTKRIVINTIERELLLINGTNYD